MKDESKQPSKPTANKLEARKRKPLASNTLPFPYKPENFLRSAGLTQQNHKEIAEEIFTLPTLAESKFPSLEVLAGWNNDPSSLYQYIDKVVDVLNVSGKVLLYGAGTLTGRYIDYLNAKSDITVVAILDEKGEALGDFQGYPVISPKNHDRFDFDQLLILHFHWEENMAETALEAGVPSHKIITGITHLGLQEDLKASCLVAIEHLNKKFGPCENLILTTLAPKWSVMDLDDCDELLPPDRSHLIVFSNPNMHYESWKLEKRPFISCPRSRPFLKLLLEAFKPRNIYLKISPHTHSDWIPLFARAVLPHSRIIVEYYDMAALFSPGFLTERLDYRSHDHVLADAATYAASKGEVDAMVVKSGGENWRKLAESFGTPAITLFPLISASRSQMQPPMLQHAAKAVEQRGENPRYRVVYAGSVPAEELKHGLGSFPGANMFKYLYRLVEGGDIEVDLYNAGDHDYLETSEDNQILRTAFSEGPIRYHCSIPFTRLLSIGHQYDFAFTAVHYAGDFTENVTRSGIGNRFMGYLMAGMPVIVDSYFEYQAELVDRFNAGLVIEPERLDELPEMIRNADLCKLRQGVLDLLAYMQKANMESFSRIQTILKA